MRTQVEQNGSPTVRRVVMRYPKNRKSSPRKGNALGIPKTPSERTCIQCAAKFIGHGGNKYCSLRCRLEPYIDRSGECWTWLGYKRADGYGEVYIEKYGVRTRPLAHRAVYTAFVGDPGEAILMHACDNPSCVNPAHLSAGTRAENTADRDTKQRQARGEKNGSAKLTEADVRSIRADERGCRRMAKQYGVAVHTILAIRRGKTWKHVV